MAGLVDRRIKRDEAKEAELAASRASMAADWAARFAGPPIRWDGACPLDANLVPHVHPRHGAPGAGFNIDPRTGRWVRPGEAA